MCRSYYYEHSHYLVDNNLIAVPIELFQTVFLLTSFIYIEF